jgi:hypothetical protein
MPRHQNNPKSKPVISKTYAELMAMVASSSLVVGQQYSTKIYTKYIQPKTGKLKIGVYDFYDATPEQIEDC